MQLHSNATTTFVTRRKIHEAGRTMRAAARAMSVSLSTVHRWRHRDTFEDASSRPGTIKCSIDEDYAEKLLEMRKRGDSLDAIYEVVLDERPQISRSAVYRLLKRHGLNRLVGKSREAKKEFKQYPPGYLHIDLFYMPRILGMRSYCFVAVDRCTRRTHVMWSMDRTQKSGAAFLKECLKVFEFKIFAVLTDNGTEFTNKTYAGPYGKAKVVHEFDAVCVLHKIKHRLTKPRTPKTNGLVERHNRIIKSATVNSKTYPTIEAAVADITAWNERNNHRRKRTLKYSTPSQITEDWRKLKPEAYIKEPIAA
jgi:transposase InsO family protein